MCPVPSRASGLGWQRPISPGLSGPVIFSAFVSPCVCCSSVQATGESRVCNPANDGLYLRLWVDRATFFLTLLAHVSNNVTECRVVCTGDAESMRKPRLAYA